MRPGLVLFCGEDAFAVLGKIAPEQSPKFCRNSGAMEWTQEDRERRFDKKAGRKHHGMETVCLEEE